ncbi:unnamed protein product [Acanthoscelides obtectus]|uniref:Phenoloxidase-activating factor 2 n=1 Tax=Acanthoscelides obtectus TaxID=200917 RepID=A0A9P0PSR7_ACAOB|nr:unnamed protein product [Acanthoscelides obtectus]CAK1673351.1 Phenoloxidase-activating factor 2 [Acanthoscelides obtectus]
MTLLVTLLLFSNKILNVLSSADGDFVGDYDFQHCVCVPYWQCKEDYSGLIEDGIDIIDIRSADTGDKSGKYPSRCTGDYDVCCQVECGKRRIVRNGVLTNRMGGYVDFFATRILGDNNEAEFAEFPWMLGLLEDKTYRCGASLIHPQVALTAAHCVMGDGPFIIRAGEWNWESREEPLPYQNQQAKEIIIHPQYHPGSLRNDIAILILEAPFRLSENVGIVCLPFQGTEFEDIRNQGSDCIATGWGKNAARHGKYQATLKKVSMPVLPRNDCTWKLREVRLGPFFRLHKSFICAGGQANKDTCKGDGGSPLVCPIRERPGKYQQAGIVSWGLTCGLHATPGVYVNIALFRDWIDFIVQAYGFDSTVYRVT